MIEHIEQGTLPAHVKACIALTSWKKRINTVGLTIYNLFETCGPDYHIVLTLAEEEFPKKEQELPRDLLLMNKTGVFEILWVKKNRQAFKKWLYCSLRYPSMPIVTADDDCLYLVNYADMMYSVWKRNKTCIVTLGKGANGNKELNMEPWPTGSKSLYPPYCFKNLWVSLVDKICDKTNDDDTFYAFFINHVFHYRIISPFTDDERNVYVFHDCIDALSSNKKKYGQHQAMQVILDAIKGMHI